MADVGSPLDYFARVFGNFEFSISGVFALNHAVAIIGMVTGIFLSGLALFIFRSGSKDLKNQAIGMILLIEGFMAATHHSREASNARHRPQPHNGLKRIE